MHRSRLPPASFLRHSSLLIYADRRFKRNRKIPYVYTGLFQSQHGWHRPLVITGTIFLETANSRYVADPRPTALHELGVSQTVANNRVHCAAPQQATRPQISAFYPFVYSVPCLGPNRIRSFGTEAQSLRVEKIFFKISVVITVKR